MSKRTYHKAQTPNLVKISNPVLINNTEKKGKSRSYLSKLREKQEQLARENQILSYLNYKSEEFTEKPSVHSENSLGKYDSSFEQKASILAPEDEEILNVIRLQQPKAEICSGSRLNSARNPSPSKNFMVSERCEEFEKDLKTQRAKYRKLEAQYNELLNKNSHIEMFYSDILGNLKRELEEQEDDRDDPLLEEMNEDIIEIRIGLGAIQKKFLILEEKLKIKG